MDQLFDIKGKTAVITGATGVLGNEMAREMARRGAKVAVMSTTRERADKLAEEPKSGEASISSCQCIGPKA